MKTRNRLAAVVLAGSTLALLQVNVAQADTATVTANITAGGIGLRSLTSVPAIVLTSLAGSETVDGTMTAVVAEVAVTGKNPWSVTTALDVLTDSASHTLANSNVDILGRSVLKVAGGGTAAATSGTEDLSATRTIFTNTGQSATSVYTGTYTSTANLQLHVPNGTATGIYTGTMTVTLVQ